MNLRRPVLLALVAVLGLSACASTPGAKRIALDVVDTLDVSETVKVCMRDRIQEYEENELQDIAESADAGDGAALTRFENDLRACG